MSNRYNSNHSATASTAVSYPWGDWTRYPPTLPDDYYTAIGEVCQRWSWLEFQLSVLIREGFSLSKPHGRMLTSGMPLRAESFILKSLALGTIEDTALAAKIDAFADDVLDINKKEVRHKYAHGLFGYKEQRDQRLGMFTMRSPQERDKPNWHDTPVSTIRADAERLKALQIRAQELTIELKGLRHK